MLNFSEHILAAIGTAYGKTRDTFVPPLCLACEAIVEQPGGCCPTCWSKLRFIAEPMCPVTGKPFSHDLGEGMLSAEAIADPPPYGKCRSAVLYTDETRRLITGLKYGDRTELAPWMGFWMVRAGRELLAQDVLIVPVPLHKSRLVTRRFNQSGELAKVIGKMTGLAYRPDLLLRSKNTRQQVGLSASERARNVQGSFMVPLSKKAEVKGRNILLVDDVYTSGATVKAATRSFKRAGASNVDVLTFARVETSGDSSLYKTDFEKR